MADQGIQPMPSTPYTPEQNPVAERFNCSLMEGTQALLEHAGLPLSFWVDAAMVMVFILNRSPKRLLENWSPYEVLYGKKPDLSLVQVFGCHGHVLRPKRYRTGRKAATKTDLMVYLGPSENQRAYRMWNPTTNKVVISREVGFDELTVGIPTRVAIEVSFPSTRLRIRSPSQSMPVPQRSTSNTEETKLVEDIHELIERRNWDSGEVLTWWISTSYKEPTQLSICSFGVMVRQQMTSAMFIATNGDAWIVSEEQ